MSFHAKYPGFHHLVRTTYWDDPPSTCHSCIICQGIDGPGSSPRRRGNHKKWLDLAFSKGKQVRMPYHLKQLMLDFLGKQRKINGLSLYHHFYPFMGQISPTPPLQTPLVRMILGMRSHQGAFSIALKHIQD